MKTKRRISLFGSLVMLFAVTTMVAAQYVGKTMGTAYQLVNSSDSLVTIVIDYYDPNGVVQTAAQRTFTDVEVGGSRLVIVPRDETSLAGGSYSAVISSTGPIAGIVNEQYYPTGSTNPTTPFATYSAASEGSTTVYIPSILYNYFNYYTEMFIQNVGTADATNVDITYIPGTVGGVLVGLQVQDLDLTIKQYATLKKSQQSLVALGNPAAAAPFTNRFFGGVKITSDQPLVVVVNEHNVAASKLMSFNGFSEGSTKLLATSAMRGWFTYMTAITVSNTSSTNKACVKLTYNPDLSQSSNLIRVNGSTVFSPVVAYHLIEPNMSLIRYEGSTSTLLESDLMVDYTRFNGSVTIESITGVSVGGYTCTTAVPLIGIINNESKGGSKNQAGSLNLVPVSSATNKVVLPNVLSDFWGYYTVIALANTTATNATCTFTYTAGPDSAVTSGTSKAYTHALAANSVITVHEAFVDSRSDIKSDGATWLGKFIGSATVECKDASLNQVAVIATVNEEKNLSGVDAMYAQSAFNK